MFYSSFAELLLAYAMWGMGVDIWQFLEISKPIKGLKRFGIVQRKNETFQRGFFCNVQLLIHFCGNPASGNFLSKK